MECITFHLKPRRAFSILENCFLKFVKLAVQLPRRSDNHLVPSWAAAARNLIHGIDRAFFRARERDGKAVSSFAERAEAQRKRVAIAALVDGRGCLATSMCVLMDRCSRIKGADS